MKFLFWRHKKRNDKLQELEESAAQVHKENISNIVQTRKKIDKLNKVLKQNNITLQLAKVTGHN